MVISILEDPNFRVCSPNSSANALKLSEEGDDKIDLLLYDVDMPQISGPDLGEALKKKRPDMHVTLISGEANGDLLVLNYGWVYIQKP